MKLEGMHAKYFHGWEIGAMFGRSDGAKVQLHEGVLPDATAEQVVSMLRRLADKIESEPDRE